MIHSKSVDANGKVITVSFHPFDALYFLWKPVYYEKTLVEIVIAPCRQIPILSRCEVGSRSVWAPAGAAGRSRRSCPWPSGGIESLAASSILVAAAALHVDVVMHSPYLISSDGVIRMPASLTTAYSHPTLRQTNTHGLSPRELRYILHPRIRPLLTSNAVD